jgi:hypothetical protein
MVRSTTDEVDPYDTRDTPAAIFRAGWEADKRLAEEGGI